MTRWGWPLIRAGLGLVVLLAVLRLAGTDAVALAWSRVTAGTLGFAFLATLAATCACAWRWAVVARAAQLTLPVRTAIGACYRSQLVNATVPGGVVGDIDRALAYGRGGALRTSARVVIVERLMGQLVQVGLTLVAVAWLPSPWRPALGGSVGLTSLAVALVATGLVVAVRRRAVRRTDLVGVTGASALVVLAHAATYVAAGLAVVGNRGPQLFVVALLVLAGSAIPLSLAGWGPREGVALWAGTQIGLGAADALAISVVFGLVSVVALTPGVLTFVPRRRVVAP